MSAYNCSRWPLPLVLCFSPEFPGGCGVPGPRERARRPGARLPRDQGGQRPHLRLQDRQHRLGQHPLRGQQLVQPSPNTILSIVTSSTAKPYCWRSMERSQDWRDGVKVLITLFICRRPPHSSLHSATNLDPDIFNKIHPLHFLISIEI